MITEGWIPPKSPHEILQETLWPDEWKILVACLLLNLTSRKQVDKMIDLLFEKYPDAETMRDSDPAELYDILKPLDLANKRVKTLKRFSSEYLYKEWKTASELYGCGKYANDAWRIFCKGDWTEVKPEDHALNLYHDWLLTEKGEST